METRRRDQGPVGLAQLAAEVAGCRSCPRLVAWREKVAAERRAAFAGEDYWGKPVPGFGDPTARLLLVGLAPAAHGANRTGRMFTGDRSGDFLYRALWRAGYANQPSSERRDDGLALRGAWVTSVVKCAPPGNKPQPDERDRCLPFLERELDLLAAVRVIVALGQFGWAAVAAHFDLRPRPRFAHLAEQALPGGLVLLGSFHPSQQNTFTGRLTEPMFDAVLERARSLGG